MSAILSNRYAPTDYTCTACSAVIQSFEEVDKHDQHVGCGGTVMLAMAVIALGPNVPVSELAAQAIADAADVTTDPTKPKPPTPHALWLRANQGEPSEAKARAVYSSLMRDYGYIVPQRRRMAAERRSITRTFKLSEDGKAIEFEFIVGLFDDGTPGEIFIHADRQGATLSGFLDATGIMISMLLQYGVPLPKVIGKLKGMRFPPDGRTTIGKPGTESVFAMSPLDLLARWLETFVPKENRGE